MGYFLVFLDELFLLSLKRWIVVLIFTQYFWKLMWMASTFWPTGLQLVGGLLEMIQVSLWKVFTVTWVRALLLGQCFGVSCLGFGWPENCHTDKVYFWAWFSSGSVLHSFSDYLCSAFEAYLGGDFAALGLVWLVWCMFFLRQIDVRIGWLSAAIRTPSLGYCRMLSLLI